DHFEFERTPATTQPARRRCDVVCADDRRLRAGGAPVVSHSHAPPLLSTVRHDRCFVLTGASSRARILRMSPEPLSSLLGRTFDPIPVSWDSKDTMLYAVGVGARPETELDFLF